MKLRTRLNLVVAGLTASFFIALILLEFQATRASIREESEAANRVAAQLLGRLTMIYSVEGGPELALRFLQQTGHVRSNDIELRGSQGPDLYRSPPPSYKAGREAPAWFSRLTAPLPARSTFLLPGDLQLIITSNPSRAVLDAWDDLRRLLLLAGGLFILVNAMAFWSVDQALAPFPIIAAGFRHVQQGDLAYRLPPLRGFEAREIGDAFNRMAQAVQDKVQVERQAHEAEACLEERREMAMLVEQRVEEERRLIAHELHDEFGQSVTAIRSLALAIASQNSPHDSQTADTARLIAAEAARLYDAMHGLIPRLMPMSLDTLGLADTLENLIRDWQRRTPVVTLSLQQHIDVPLGPSITLAIYRVVQEGLINSLRHAQASRIEVSVGSHEHRILVTVADNGVGMPSVEAPAGHFGLRGLAERISRLGGVFTIEKNEPSGVRLSAEIPLAAADMQSRATR